MSAVMEKEHVDFTGPVDGAVVEAQASPKAYQFVAMLISEGQVSSQEQFASAAYQAHYEKIRDKMFGKKAEPSANRKAGAQKKAAK